MDFEHFGLYERSYNDIINYFKQNPKITLVKIFGSRAKGYWEKCSDIDFIIFDDVTVKEASGIAAELDELPTPYKFDVISYVTIDDPRLKEKVDTQAIVFYQKE